MSCTTLVEVPDSCPDFKGRATSGFRPNLHSRAESLSLENLDMSRAVGRENLNISKFGRESLDLNYEQNISGPFLKVLSQNLRFYGQLFSKCQFQSPLIKNGCRKMVQKGEPLRESIPVFDQLYFTMTF